MSGNDLEKSLNRQNILYRKDGKALILKVEVPIILTQSGLVAKQSTVDYTGIIKGGLGIAFDAKESINKTSFPLNNIKDHQLMYLSMFRDYGGLAFFLIHLKHADKNKLYVTPISLIEKYWFFEKRKSIPFSEFNDNWVTTIDSYIDKVEEIKTELYVKYENIVVKNT